MGYQKTKNFIQIQIRWNGQKSLEKSYKKLSIFLVFADFSLFTIFFADKNINLSHFKCFVIRIKFCVFLYLLIKFSWKSFPRSYYSSIFANFKCIC